MFKEDHSALLPNGLVDLLPTDAETEAAALQTLMRTFAGFGYRRVKPPLVEFEETLLQGLGQGLSRQTFRMMDPVSRRMMGVRADITPQIARLAGSRFEPYERPLRLAYAGEVLRVKGSQLRPERQFLQAGCELIGVDDVQADVECIIIAVIGLKNLQIEDISIDLSLPAFIRTLLGEDADPDLMEALDQKDRQKVAAKAGAHAQILKDLLALGHSAEEGLAALKEMDLPATIRPDIDRLIAVTAGVMAAFEELEMQDVQITLDPLERSVFDYHRGVAFTLLAQSVRGELGRGGRYDFETETGHDTAIGFTLYMDTLRRIVPPPEQPEIQTFQTKQITWAEVRELQSKGFQVIREFN